MSEMTVVVNADDFGLTDGVCRAILESMEKGVVTSTTIMTCVPGALELVRKYAPQLKDRAGVHLQLSCGRPLSRAMPSIVDEQGNFPAKGKMIKNADHDEVVREFSAQIRAVMDCGVVPTHLDGHHHVHSYPFLRKAFVEVAREFSLPARALDNAMAEDLRAHGVECTDMTIESWYNEDVSLDNFTAFLEQARKDGCSTVDLMTHPGFVDADLAAISSYCNQRATELSILTDPALRRKLEGMNLRLTSYNGIL